MARGGRLSTRRLIRAHLLGRQSSGRVTLVPTLILSANARTRASSTPPRPATRGGRLTAALNPRIAAAAIDVLGEASSQPKHSTSSAGRHHQTFRRSRVVKVRVPPRTRYLSTRSANGSISTSTICPAWWYVSANLSDAYSSPGCSASARSNALATSPGRSMYDSSSAAASFSRRFHERRLRRTFLRSGGVVLLTQLRWIPPSVEFPPQPNHRNLRRGHPILPNADRALNPSAKRVDRTFETLRRSTDDQPERPPDRRLRFSSSAAVNTSTEMMAGCAGSLDRTIFACVRQEGLAHAGFGDARRADDCAVPPQRSECGVQAIGPGTISAARLPVGRRSDECRPRSISEGTGGRLFGIHPLPSTCSV